MDNLTSDDLDDFIVGLKIPSREQSYAMAVQLADAMRENERLQNAISNLEPLRNIDWHGKWRIHACLDALSNKDSAEFNKVCVHDGYAGPSAGCPHHSTKTSGE